MDCHRYRSTTNVNLPLRVLPTITENGTREVSYVVTVKANFNPKLSATSVMLRIPTPLNTTTVDCKAPNGKAKYVPAENVIVWKYAWFNNRPGNFTLTRRQDPAFTGWFRMYPDWYRVTYGSNPSTSMGKATDRRGLSSAYVHRLGSLGALLEGLREKQLQ